MELEGYHSPSFCTSFGRGCPNCRSEIRPFEDLDEEQRTQRIKEIGQLLRLLEDLGYKVLGQPGDLGPGTDVLPEGPPLEPQSTVVAPRVSTYPRL